jgi:signal transduction histidine kinase
MTDAAGSGRPDGEPASAVPAAAPDAASDDASNDDAASEALARERMEAADRRMADAEALLEVASAQLSVAARNIASANAAEREYRRAVWHYTQLMKHRISNPLQTIIGMADTLRDMPDLERSRRQAMIEAIGQQARVLRDVSLEPRVVAETERVLRPQPLEAAVRMHRDRVDAPMRKATPTGASGSVTPVDDREAGDVAREGTGEQQERSPFTRFGRERFEDRRPPDED